MRAPQGTGHAVAIATEPVRPRPGPTAPTAPTGLLVALARDGDENAFEELVRSHQDRAYAIALRMTGTHHDAQDVVQDAFLHAWQGLPRFRGDAQFGTWLTSIVLNSCHTRRRNTRPADPLPQDTTSNPSPGADTLSVARAQQEAVQNAIVDLPFEQRAALVLHVFTGLSHAQTGQVLGISEGAAKVRVHRARKALTTRLQEWR